MTGKKNGGARKLEDVLRFEELISKISTRFVSLPSDEVDRKIEDSLRLIGEYLGTGRIAVLQFSADMKNLSLTHGYAGVEAHRPPRFLVSDRLPWFSESLRLGKTLRISGIDDLPEEAAAEREYVGKQGFKSFLTIPMKVGGSTIGGISYSDMERERPWPDDLVNQVRMVTEAIAGALDRKRADEKIRDLMEQLNGENVYLREETARTQDSNGMLGDSVALGEVLRQAGQVAPTDTTVLITGETGVGKELLARAIHEQSGRRGRPMVTVNCSALPPTLVEAELFGREKGAYTGSMSRQKGRFEIADGSTLFLDEVGDLPPATQPKLLRALQEGIIERLGSPREIKVDVRLIAATNRDMKAMAADGRLRQDLFYRLNVFPVHVPPLRERQEDIPQLVWHFVRKYAGRMGKQIDHIPEGTLKTLTTLPWPGNVRELSNVVEHAVITASARTLQVGASQIKTALEAGDRKLETVERRHIKAILEECGWKISGPGGAAESLGLKPTTLRSRMEKLGIHRP